MDFKEFEEEQKERRERDKESGFTPLPTEHERLPRHVFVSHQNGTCFYATMSEDGRVIPIDECNYGFMPY